MRRFTVRDPAFLGAAGGIPAPITPDDPDTQGWWKADSYVTENTAIGDKLNATVDKVSYSAPNFNLRPYNTILGVNGGTGRGNADNDANYLFYSENLSFAPWAASNFTKNTATTGTFTATGGYVRQAAALTDEASVFTYKFQARRITGNTDLQILTVNAPEGDKTPVTLTGSLAWYSVTFTGVAGTEIICGIQDDNGAGFGQIEITQQHVYRSDHDGNYLPTTAVYRSGKRNGVPVFATGAINWGAFFVTAALRTNAAPFTIYCSVYYRQPYDAWFLVGNNPTVWGELVAATPGPPADRLSTYVNIAPFAWQYSPSPNIVTRGGWSIVTVVFNGASSEQRVNLNTADVVSHPVAQPNMNQMQFGGDSFAGYRFGGDFHEAIMRYTADDTETQDKFINYMAGQVGLTL
ncbi:MAG: hypothetical protein ACYSUV_02095 [Planctomycetota bacterium]|jgi:hypothetical protein